METNESVIEKFLLNPRETLQFELKRWISPSSDEGRVKIAKGCMALRNNNGGYLVFGFRDDGTPDSENIPSNVREEFHADVIQRIVGEFSSELFPVDVKFVTTSGVEYPVICVPAGVRTPVACKRDLVMNGRQLIRDHAVYVRSLSSNSTVSSSEARRGDWDRMVAICLDNREADIGAFVRRHLSPLDLGQLREALSGVTSPPRVTPLELAETQLVDGKEHFLRAMQKRRLQVPDIGFREAAMVIDGEVPANSPTDSFLQSLFVAQPQHTGWPAWVDSRRFHDTSMRPQVVDGSWQALIADYKAGFSNIPKIAFWRINPAGRFYLLTGLEDDLGGTSKHPKPGTELDFLLQISRVAEILSVGIAFAKAMKCDPENTSVVFAFRWSGLNGRQLTSWVEPQRGLRPLNPSYQDEQVATAVVPLDVAESAIVAHVEIAVKPLFSLFDGMEFDKKVIEDIAMATLRRRM